MDETNRRRKIQDDYNKKNGITPKTIIKAVYDVIEATRPDKETAAKRSKKDVQKLIVSLTKEMQKAAKMLDFELAASLRDKIKELSENING